MNTREQLETLLKSHSMREIGRAAGLTHHTVSKFLSGKSVSLESFKKIELAVTNLTQLDAEKAAFSDGAKAAVRAHSAQVNDLIARLADADLERVAMAERCKMQAESLGAYQLRVALLECDRNVYKAAENACIYHQQETMDERDDHAMTIETLNKNAANLEWHKQLLAEQTQRAELFAFERDTVNLERTILKKELQNIYGDHMFMQGLRIGLKYTAVFLVLLLIVAAVCWIGGV